MYTLSFQSINGSTTSLRCCLGLQFSRSQSNGASVGCAAQTSRCIFTVNRTMGVTKYQCGNILSSLLVRTWIDSLAPNIDILMEKIRRRFPCQSDSPMLLLYGFSQWCWSNEWGKLEQKSIGQKGSYQLDNGKQQCEESYVKRCPSHLLIGQTKSIKTTWYARTVWWKYTSKTTNKQSNSTNLISSLEKWLMLTLLVHRQQWVQCPLSSSRTASLTKSIAGFICKEFGLYSVAKNYVFCQMLQTLELMYEMQSRKHFTEQATPALLWWDDREVVGSLQSAETIELTCDGWTSRPTESYLNQGLPILLIMSL